MPNYEPNEKLSFLKERIREAKIAHERRKLRSKNKPFHKIREEVQPHASPTDAEGKNHGN